MYPCVGTCVRVQLFSHRHAFVRSYAQSDVVRLAIGFKQMLGIVMKMSSGLSLLHLEETVEQYSTVQYVAGYMRTSTATYLTWAFRHCIFLLA
jgi:hypothetical protein